jgi:hypothetical protein
VLMLIFKLKGAILQEAPASVSRGLEPEPATLLHLEELPTNWVEPMLQAMLQGVICRLFFEP